MAIAWDPQLSIGVEEIDAQHRELFERIDRLLEASRSGTSASEVGALLDFLAEYVRAHFRDEEALMAQTRFAHLDEHRAEHDAFARELEALRGEHASEGGTALVVVRVTRRATQWLAEHIYRSDRQLGKHVQAVAQ